MTWPCPDLDLDLDPTLSWTLSGTLSLTITFSITQRDVGNPEVYFCPPPPHGSCSQNGSGMLGQQPHLRPPYPHHYQHHCHQTHPKLHPQIQCQPPQLPACQFSNPKYGEICFILKPNILSLFPFSKLRTSQRKQKITKMMKMKLMKKLERKIYWGHHQEVS